MARSGRETGRHRAPREARLGSGLLLGIAVGLLVLLLVWFVFLRGDDPAPSASSAPPPVAEAVDEAPVEEAPAAPRRRGPVETFEVFAPKDPFDPLISASAGGGGGGGTATTAGAGTTTTTAGPDGTTTTTTTIRGNAPGDRIEGHRVRVVDVFREGEGRRAQIQIDDTVYTVDRGERFAQNFQLLSTSGDCATMLYGDDEFTLCEGEEILK